MPVPIVYRSGEQFIKSYDFIDTLTGSGVAQLYLSDTEDDTGQGFIALGHATDSNSKFTHFNGNTSGWEKVKDQDFDLRVVKSLFLKGSALLNFTTWLDAFQSPAAQMYLKIKIRKWNGTTETEIADVQTKTQTAVATDNWFREQVQLDVPKTYIGNGEFLRITVEMWFNETNNRGCKFYHDPTNREPVDTDNKSTNFICEIPVLVT